LQAVQAVMHGESSIATTLSLADVVDFVQARAKAHGQAETADDIIDDLSLGAPAVWKRFVGASLPEPGVQVPAKPSTHRPGATTLRILARQHDASMAGNAAAAQRAVAAAEKAFPSATVIASSGSLVLDETSQAMVPATLRSILLPLPCIALLLWLTTRSLRLALLAIPIAGLPLLITYAQLWPLGWPIDIGVSMIACVGLGMIVDDTVRMFLALCAEERGHQKAASYIGPVLVGGCLAMAGSFIACLAGQFAYTRHFGVLLAAAFLIALLVNMTLTPALLSLLAPRTPHKGQQ
jgi:predicted RND superfamily exporter protein